MHKEVVHMDVILAVAAELKKAIQEGDSFCCGGKVIASGLVDTAVQALKENSVSAIQISSQDATQNLCDLGYTERAEFGDSLVFYRGSSDCICVNFSTKEAFGGSGIDFKPMTFKEIEAIYQLIQEKTSDSVSCKEDTV